MALRARHSPRATWRILPTLREREDKSIAAHYVSERFPVVRDTMNVGEIHEYLTARGKDLDTIDYIYVTNAAHRLVGVISLRHLFTHPKKTPVRSIMKRDLIVAAPEMHTERIARLALEHDLRAIPIVKNHRLEGVIQTTTILHIINRTLRENLLILSGVHKEHLEYEDALHVPVLTSLIHRVPWLIIGLAGVFVAAGVVDEFQALLSTHLIVAFFIPAILYMSNALGTQNQTLLIRDLAIQGKELPLASYFVRTVGLGAIISIIIGTLVYVAIYALWNDSVSSFAIALAMATTLFVTSATSTGVTMLFRYLGQDPATGSGPFATIISDLSSILIYFLIVSALI